MASNKDDGNDFDESHLPPEIAAINSRETLSVYLNERPPELSRILAWRIAMRVFPLLLVKHKRKPKQTQRVSKHLILISFRALFVSSIAHKYPDDKILKKFAAAAAAYAADAAATATAAAAYAAYADVWFFVRNDLNKWKNSTVIDQDPLWPFAASSQGENPALNLLNQFKQSLDDNSDWQLIIQWYEALIPIDPDTKPYSIFSEDVERRLASQPSEFWGGNGDNLRNPEYDPDEVMQRIATFVGFSDQMNETAAVGEAEGSTTGPESVDGDDQSIKPDQTTSPKPNNSHADFVSDRPENENDYLDRAPLAMALAGKLNIIWHKYNDDANGRKAYRFFDPRGWFTKRKIDWDDGRLDTGFVVHLDAPWGGGKTTFVQYLTRILNPYRDTDQPPKWLNELEKEKSWNEKFRIPWHIVEFDAWQHQHVNPPWWVFWQAIYKQCMRSVLLETNQRGTDYPDPVAKYYYRGPIDRLTRWCGIWLMDIKWRVFAPGMLPKIGIFGGLAVLWWFLSHNGILQISGDSITTGTNLSDGMGALLASLITLVITVVPVLWGATKVWGDTLLPGTPNSAENYGKGAGDPLEDFRKYFAKTMRRLDRPVLVVVDNLDRCHAEFVVKLIHGMQTVLVSPRVVFVLLGDRDWIEQSFTDQYQTMQGIDVGPEHEFGARFVEKAIQLSFILPRISQSAKDDFIKNILGGEEYGPQVIETLDPVVEQLSVKLEEVMDGRTFNDREDLSTEFRSTLEASEISPEGAERFKRQLNRKLATRAATDATTEIVTKHALRAVSELMPPNPRQVIRIINSIVLIQEMARIQRDISPGGRDWQLLVRWIVLMTEWPKSWFTLSKQPELADRIIKKTNRQNQYGIQLDKNPDVLEILKFDNGPDDWKDNPIDTAAVNWLIKVMPPTSGKMLDPGNPEPEKPASSNDL